MKKFYVLIVSIFLIFGIVACAEDTTTNMITINNQTTSFQTTNSTSTTVTNTTEVIFQLAALSEEEITLEFWHAFSSSQEELLNERILEFEAIYPNININATNKGDYDQLSYALTSSVLGGLSPNAFAGDALIISELNYSNQLLKLDKYLNSNIVYDIDNVNSTEYGESYTLGYDLNNIFTELAERNNMGDSGYVALPLYFQTEVVIANIDILKAHVTEIRNSGVTISNNGHISLDNPLTYNQLELLNLILVDSSGTNLTNMQTEYLMNYDFVSNLFLNTSRQWDLNVNDAAGNLFVHDDETISMLQYLDTLFTNNTLALPSAWDQSYGSTNFKQGDVALSVTRSNELRYNIPTVNDPQESLKLGIFNIDVLPVPQYTAFQGEEITVNEVTFNSNQSASYESISVGIFDQDQSDEELMSYIFMKFLMNDDFLAELSLLKNYFPATFSAYNSQGLIEISATDSMSYEEFIAIANDYWDNDGVVTWDSEDIRWVYLYNSMAANIALDQCDIYYKYPYFATGLGLDDYKIFIDDLNDCLENICNGVYTPIQALEEVMD